MCYLQKKNSQFLSETTILYQLLTCVFFCEFSRVFHPIGAPSPMISHRSQDSGASLAVEFSSCWNACKAWVTDFSAHGNNMEHIVDSKIVLCLSTFELVEKHRSNLKLNLLLVFIRYRKRWNHSKMFKARSAPNQKFAKISQGACSHCVDLSQLLMATL